METNLVVKSPTELSFQAFERLEAIATKLAQSKLIPTALQNKPADVAIILQMGYELEMGPMQAINGIDVIQGKPSVKPEMQVAMIKAKVPNAYISVNADEKAMKVTVTMAPSKDRMDEAFTTVWDMARAKAMQLDKKDNYLKQPLVMLRWRALGEAARTVFPHITKGLKNTVEAEDWDNVQAPDGSKADKLSSMIKPPEKEVQVEVAPVQESPVKIVERLAEKASDVYVIPAQKGLAISGKTFQEVSRGEILELYNNVFAYREKSGKPLAPQWAEFLEKADAYLDATGEPKEASFDEFESGSSG